MVRSQHLECNGESLTEGGGRTVEVALFTLEVSEVADRR
jgi:hypothetical protein